MKYLDTVRAYVVDTFLYGDGARLGEDTPFLENGIIDSTGVLELVGYLENTFAIRVEDEEIVPENLNSLRSISGYLERKLSSSKPV